MKASLSNYHQAPRKVRLVADLIRGKSVPAARVALSYLPKKSGPALAKLLNSAVANAVSANNGIDVDMLFVKTITVDKGAVLKRVRPFKQGRAGRIHKIMSIVRLELGTKGGVPVVAKTFAVDEVKTAQPAAESVKATKPRAAKKVSKKASAAKK